MSTKAFIISICCFVPAVILFWAYHGEFNEMVDELVSALAVISMAAFGFGVVLKATD